MPPELSVPEARQILSAGDLRFGDDTQIAAVQKLDRSGERSESQHSAWKRRRDRFRKRVRQALDREIHPCPHCGRLPWFLSAHSTCAARIMELYDMRGRQCPPSWFVEFSGQWRSQFVSQKAALRMVKD